MSKVLIVDDDAKIVEMLEIGLNAMGYDTVAAYDGGSVFQIVIDEAPDIILLDLNLPKKDGIAVCQEIREKMKDNYIPIIMVTARDDQQSKIDGLDVGADDYITKPVDIKEVMARIRSMLRLKSMNDELKDARDELKELAVRDYLTSCYNRRYFMEILMLEVKKAVRYDRVISCIMLDLDYFKNINDNYGHPVGDIVLRWFADVLRDNLRDSDIVGRYGGEEFIVLLPNISTQEEMELICNRIRETVEKTTVNVGDNEINLTVSIGGSIFEGKNIPDVENIIEKIDNLLYDAKRAGRNCCKLK